MIRRLFTVAMLASLLAAERNATGLRSGRRCRGWSACPRGHVQAARRRLRRQRGDRDLLPDDLPGWDRGQRQVLRQSRLDLRQQGLHLGPAGDAGWLRHREVPAEPDTGVQRTGRSARQRHRAAAALCRHRLRHRHQQGGPPDRSYRSPAGHQPQGGQAVRPDRSLVGRMEQGVLQPGLTQAGRHSTGPDQGSLRAPTTPRRTCS